MTLLMRIALIFLSLSLFTATHAYSASNGTCAPGTYLVNEGSGTQSLWTFNKDGTIQVASSAQGALNFSDGQGAWRKWRSRQARVTFLDVNFRLSPVNGGFPPSAIGRVDALFTFSKNCKTVEGSFELRFFDPETEDPLDPATDSGEPIQDSFTGRRVTAK